MSDTAKCHANSTQRYYAMNSSQTDTYDHDHL